MYGARSPAVTGRRNARLARSVMMRRAHIGVCPPVSVAARCRSSAARAARTRRLRVRPAYVDGVDPHTVHRIFASSACVSSNVFRELREPLRCGVLAAA